MRKRVLAFALAISVAAGMTDIPAFAMEPTKVEQSEGRQEKAAGTVEPLTLGKEISGKITGARETKSYQFTLPKSGRVTWKVSSYVNYSMKIIDAAGKSVWTKVGDCDKTTGYLEDTLTVDLTKGTYYLEFTGISLSNFIGSSSATKGTWKIGTSFAGVDVTYPEPNNSSAQASAVAFQKYITGQIAENDDRDIYKITLTSAGRLNIDMTSYMKYYTMDLSDKDGKRVWMSDRNIWNESMGKCTDNHQVDLAAGTYYLEIMGKKAIEPVLSAEKLAKSTGTYQFRVNFQNARVNHKEPNNDDVSACQINSGAEVRGQIALNDSCDIFYFNVAEKRDVKIALTSYMKYYCIYVYDSNGNQKLNDEDNVWNTGTGSRRDNYTLTLEKGKYYLKITGNERGNHNPYTGNYTLKVTYKTKKNLKDAKVSKISNQPYTGKVIVPKVTVKYKGTTLKLNKDYTVSASQKKIGSAKVTLKGKGDYTGTKQITFKIVPKKPSLSKVKNSKSKTVVITWKRDKNVTGYEIYRSTSKKKNYKKIKTITKNKTTSYNNTELKKNKTYYYKIRSYKKSGKQKYYSSYSKVISVKIKK